MKGSNIWERQDIYLDVKWGINVTSSDMSNRATRSRTVTSKTSKICPDLHPRFLVLLLLLVSVTQTRKENINVEKQVPSKLRKWEPDMEEKQKKREGWLKSERKHAILFLSYSFQNNQIENVQNMVPKYINSRMYKNYNVYYITICDC